MNIYLYYIFEIGLLILIIMAIVVAFREATAEEPDKPGADESAKD